MNREEIISSAAALLAERPLETVSISDVSTAAGVAENHIGRYFASMHDIGTAILTYEGASMRAAQDRAAVEAITPLERLCLAFRFVGNNLALDVIVRAGIRIAGESHRCFPERKINPFRTWRSFVLSALQEAEKCNYLREDANLENAAWLLTAAGLGTKDLLMFTEAWEKAPELLEQCARMAISTITK